MGNRLRQVSKRDASPDVLKIYQELFGDRDPVAQPGTATGTPGDYWTTYALVPEILTMSRDSLMGMLAPGRALDARYRELAILRAGIVGDSRFEYSQHMKVARMVGIAEEKLASIKGWATSDKFDAAERAVMAAADELVGRRHLSDEQIMELVYVIALWRMHGLIVRALHLEYDGDTTARMAEIPAPPPKG